MTVTLFTFSLSTVDDMCPEFMFAWHTNFGPCMLLINPLPPQPCPRTGDVYLVTFLVVLGFPRMFLLQSSAKNHKYVTICTSPEQYPAVMAEMQANVRDRRVDA